MKFVEQTVAGIDISQERICITLLKKGKNGPKLVKSVTAAVPAGAIRDGNITDPVLLGKTIREMKVRNRIWTNRAAVTLFVRPFITQIIEMPKQMPPNLNQFIRGEMKHCAAMPSGDIVLDYYLVGSNKRSADKKIMAVAAETTKVTELINVLARAGFSAELVEPAMLSYLRAINDRKIIGKSGCNVLAAVIRENILTICVLRNGAVDFIRTKEIRQKFTADGFLYRWLAAELAEIQKFYSVEMLDNTSKWDVTVFTETVQMPQAAETILKSKLQAASVQVRTSKDVHLDTIFGDQTANDANKPSPIAVGLALNVLMGEKEDVRLNLMPPQIVHRKEAKIDVLIAVNIIVALLLLMIIAVDVPAYLVEKINRVTASKAASISVGDIDRIVEKNCQLDARLEALSNHLNSINAISTTQNDVNWVQLFDNIRKATPASVRITSLSSADGLRMKIDGLALSNDAVNLFVSSLEKSPDIVSVTLLETSKQEGQTGFINYQISCKFNVKKGKNDNVS
jgi:Tfp pilus assembly protein PilN